jgi:hypothetical protein
MKRHQEWLRDSHIKFIVALTVSKLASTQDNLKRRGVMSVAIEFYKSISPMFA